MLIPGSHERAIGLEVLLQRWDGTEAFAIILHDTVAIDERPIGRSPAIRPEAVLLDDRWTQLGRELGVIRQTEGTRHFTADGLGAFRRKMQTVGGCFIPGDLGEVYVRQPALLGDLSHRGSICDENFAVLGSRQVRRTGRSHESGRRKQDDTRGMAAQVVEQFMVVGLEPGQAALPLQSLGLTELQDQGRRSGGLELPLPRTEIQVAPLFMHRVGLPGHGAEDRILVGEGGSEPRLDLAGLGLTHEVLLADEDHDLILAERKLAVLERRRRRPRRLRFAEAVEDVAFRDDGDFVQGVEGDVTIADLGLVIAVDLQSDEAIGVVDGRIGLAVGQRLLAVEADDDERTHGLDLVLVPLALLLEVGDFRLVLDADATVAGARAGEELLATGFVVERAGMAMADVGLIADHLVGRIGRAEAAELDAGIHEAFGSGQLILERQAEVIKATLSGQELVTRIAGHRAAYDLTVLDAPDLGVAVPARQGLAIKQGRRRGDQSGETGKQGQDKDESLHGGSVLGNPARRLFQPETHVVQKRTQKDRRLFNLRSS